MNTVERLKMSVRIPQINFRSQCKKVASHHGVPRTPKGATVPLSAL
jgi:hypothetical protein